MRLGLYWFRKDLRVTDNPLLAKAADACDALILLAVVPQHQWSGEQWGIPRMSGRRKAFLVASLQDLEQSIHSVGGHLHVRLGRAVRELEEMHAVQPFERLYYETYPGTEEAAEEADVAAWASKKGIELHTGQHQTLSNPLRLPFTLADLPAVFTSFRLAIERYDIVRPLAPVVNWKKILACDFSSSEFPLADGAIDGRASLDFKGGSKQAHQRLQHYIHESGMIAHYKELRNGLTGADFSSKFSPWLANGNLSAVEIYHTIKAFEALHGANDSTYWLVFELLWRDFFYFTAWKVGKRLFDAKGFGGGKGQPVRANKEVFKQWCHGSSGQPFVDAAMHELVATGFMSNRARQNVASYLVHDLGQDWRWGAAFFECHLLDYDVASNWCNWAYIAGVGNDPRAGRKFNVEKQAKDYDPQKIFIKLWSKS